MADGASPVQREVELEVDFDGLTLYEVLGVSDNASVEDIKRAYKKRILKHHPDRNSEDTEGSTKRFKKIQEAYEVLSDGQRRRQYDLQRRRPDDTSIDVDVAPTNTHTRHVYTTPRSTNATPIFSFSFSSSSPYHFSVSGDQRRSFEFNISGSSRSSTATGAAYGGRGEFRFSASADASCSRGGGNRRQRRSPYECPEDLAREFLT